MITQPLHALRTGLLALAAVLACGATWAQTSPAGRNGLNEFNGRTGMSDVGSRDRYRDDDRRRYSRQARAERERAERRRQARRQAERERRGQDGRYVDPQRQGLDGLNRRRQAEPYPGGS